LIPFAKGHGLGNDYLVIEAADVPDGMLSERAIVRICDRNWGVGSDGILLLVPTTRADFGVRIFNPDGSEAEKSGNGLRILAKYLWDHGRAQTPTFTVDTLGGVVTCACRLDNGRATSVTVEMGGATFERRQIQDIEKRIRRKFERRQIPMTGEGEAVGVSLPLSDGTPVTVTAVSVGNPHCVVFRDQLNEAEVRRLGPVLERHEVFPKRTNVQFARVLGRDAVEIMIWERGAGWTLASGSSSCGAAAAAVRNGLCDFGRVRVRMPGGELAVDVRTDWSLRLEGPVEEVYTGTLSGDFEATYVRAT
jgi:diaminopimelate epimerase